MRSAIVVLLALAFSGCAYSGLSYKRDPKFAPLLEIREDKTISYSDMAFTKGALRLRQGSQEFHR